MVVGVWYKSEIKERKEPARETTAGGWDTALLHFIADSRSPPRL